MPVKVRCSGCKKILTAPDEARGKSLRCPHCENRVRVPAEGQSGAARKPNKKKRVRQPADDDFLSGIDLRRMEDRDALVCRKCGASVIEDNELCPECGVDLATGKMPDQKRRGPDPSMFYSEVWSDSWAFLMNNRQLAVKTGIIWSILALLCIGGVGVTQQAIVWEASKILAEEETAVTTQQARIQVLNKPPVVFCAFMSLIFSMGLFGWYWFLSAKITEATMQNRKQRTLKKIEFDFFQTVVFGFKGFFWPWVLLLPFIFVASFAIVPMAIAGLLVTGKASMVGAGVAVCVNLLAMFAFPVAQVHMTMRYTYKAFLPWDMLTLFYLHAKPALYWLMMAFVVTLPMIVIVAVLVVLLGTSESVAWIESQFTTTIVWMVELVGKDPKKNGFIYGTIAFVVAAVMLAVLLTPFLIPSGFCAVFLMRANGLLGYYNRRTLELVSRQKPDMPCGFWVRYLAFVVDFGLLSLINLLLFAAYFVVGKVIIRPGLAIAILLPMWYFTQSESSIFQGTLGKRALGIIVTDRNGKRITTQVALLRFFGRILSGLILGGGYVMAAFTDSKQTLHDQLSKSLVVWQGDDERG